MSIQNSSFSKAGGAVGERYAIVLRFASLFPEALARYQMHAERRGGDLSHVDPERTAQNRLLIGGADWRKLLLQKIDEARLTNLAEELEALKRRKKIKERDLHMLEGATMPWKASSQGPLREVILTAHRDWFAGPSDMKPVLGESRAQLFERYAVAWLKDRFGDAVVHARADHDEMTYHIHAIVAPWVEKTSARRGTQRLLQPSSIPILADYEKAQDDVGKHFYPIGLKRGEKTKAAIREIIAEIAKREGQRVDLEGTGRPVPPKLAKAEDPPIPSMKKHVPTPVWWAEEKKRLAAEKKRLAAEKKRLDAEEKRLAADKRRLDAMEARLDAEEKRLRTEARRAAIAEVRMREREARAAEREEEATATVAIAEGFIAGNEPPANMPPGSLGARLVCALHRFVGRTRAEAEAEAERKLAVEFDAARAFYGRVMALKKSMVDNLSIQLRARFARESDAAQKDADATLARLDRLRTKRPEERE